MKIKGAASVLFLAVVFFLQSGCVNKAAVAEREGMQVKKTSQLSYEEQTDQAYEIFKQILDLSDSQNRQENIPQIKKLYRRIIDKYPEIALAQESYLRLIIIARQEKTVAGDAEAERLYQEFLGKYPDSNLGRILETEARREY